VLSEATVSSSDPLFDCSSDSLFEPLTDSESEFSSLSLLEELESLSLLLDEAISGDLDRVNFRRLEASLEPERFFNYSQGSIGTFVFDKDGRSDGVTESGENGRFRPWSEGR
jgi:hypothetical protein